MAATVKKKVPRKKAPDTISMGNTDHRPDQSQLEGMEDERIPAIETCVQSLVTNKTRIKEMQEQNKEYADELAGLLHKHELTSYRCCGRVVTLIAGEETVQIKKAKASKAE